MQISTRVAVGVLAAAALTATAAGTAVAAPVTTTGHFAVVAGRVVADGNPTSVSGYGADLSGYTRAAQWKATATFTVPAVTCTKKTTSALFVQLFFSGKDAAGNGLGEGGYALATCNGKTPSYVLNVSAQGGTPGGVGVETTAGDTVTVSFVATKTAATSTITNVTTGATGSQTGTGFRSLQGVQASVQGGDAHSVFPQFKRVHFTKVTAAGQALQALAPYSFQATDADGNVKIATGPIDSNGKGFTATYVGNFTPDA